MSIGQDLRDSVGWKLAEAVDRGWFYCEVCDTIVDLTGVSGFSKARSRALCHAEEHHE